MHYWHHEIRSDARLVKNYGVVFSMWDFIFDTAYLNEKADPQIGLDDHGVIAGLDLGIWWDSLDCHLLIGVDERTSKSDIQKLHDGLSLWLEEVLK